MHLPRKMVKALYVAAVYRKIARYYSTSLKDAVD